MKFPFQILVSCLFLHTYQRENTYAKLHENAPFEMKNYKNFLGMRHCPLPDPSPTGQGDTPFRTQPPRRLWRLDARAFHRQLPRMSSDPRNAPAELINIVLQWSAGSDAEPDFQLIYEDKSR